MVYLLKGFDFYPTLKLHHNSADSELDHEGLGCNLGQNQQNVSVTYVTLVPWWRERRRHVGGPTNWDLA